ncbi:transglutaminase-like putative cysteine protease [Neolewinella xylanilytica]|uniref:Transglutaminase-like putative cysteine protease n=1 Tax=Neolewinella xylanilytica TaxID=1514080 RepID=A0A2S6I4Y9_9BACT|nr:DUF3857 domain-containing protein [Neolewinella xylanilytica]PPK86244.1 transglutaminase-like putative cysteine protease [Neolewinella xylanilytica]
MRTIIVGLLVALAASGSLSAQKWGKIKFGKVSDEELAIQTAPTDSTAEAYVLYHQQDLSFNYSQEKGTVIQEKHHKRTKLFKPSSFGRADVAIRFHQRSSDIVGLRAIIHLPNGEREKIGGSQIIREDLNDQWRVVKFTFPKVTPGAIIEYEYTLEYDNILVPTPFVFQEDVPVAYAEFTAMIPEYFNYISLGTHGAFTVSESETTLNQFGPRSHQASATADTRTPHLRMRYVMEDIPPYDIQPYTNNASDYLPCVKLQLRSVEYPNQPIEYVLGDWFATAKELDEHPTFGKCYSASGASNTLWEEAEAIVLAGKTDKEKIDRAYYFICQRLRWNRNYGFTGTDVPDNILKSGTGNSADLNLSLLALLRRAGVDAYPMLVSLRDGGNHIEVYPIIDQFDHMMVYTEVDGHPYILDANGGSRPPGVPRVQALNHRAWIARPGAPQWIALEMPPAQQIVVAKVQVTADGQAEAEVKTRLSSYFAFEGREQSRTATELSGQPIAADIISVFPEAKVLDHLIDPAEPVNDKLDCSFKMTVPIAVSTDEYLYVQPILLRLLDQELDDVETRVYPVDFAHPWKKQFISTIQLPEGYVVEEMPQNIKLVSEDRGMEATYTATLHPDNSIAVRFAINLDQTVYPAAAYPTLRTMYRQIIELQEAPIILKKAK